MTRRIRFGVFAVLVVLGSLIQAGPAHAVAKTPECQGEWLPSTPTSPDVMNGELGFLDLDPVKIGEKVNWKLDPYKNRSWVMVFQSLRWAGRLVADYETTGKDAYLARATAVMKDWVEKNPYGGRSTAKLAWSDHPVSLRTPALVCLSKHVSAKWLTDSLKAHGRYLANDAHYKWGHNHGLDADIALLGVGCRMGDSGWKSKALSRMTKTTTIDVDSQGALREQSPRYAIYFHERLKVAMDRIRECGQKVPAELAKRWNLLPEHISAATMPNGYLVPIGDGAADVQPSAYDRPNSKVQIYKAGYVFGRSSWDSKEASYYSIRYGPGMKFHGHEDHLGVTYYAQGRSILTEAGFHSYESSPYRNWTLSPEAHNVPIPQGRRLKPGTASTLVKKTLKEDRQSYTLSDRAYGVSRTRAVLVNHDKKDVMAVLDTVSSGKVRNLWHLDPRLSVAGNVGGRVVVKDNDWRASVVQFSVPGCKPVTGQKIVSGRPSPFQGWISQSYMQKVAAPVIVSPDAKGLLTVVVPGSAEGAVTCSGSTVLVHTPNGPVSFKISGKNLF
ncbi:heparinase II/III domain-containing protein [Herbidospora mongoliensis]|uniref:heparinase II/III domain-containing protein n=1 Tax=Herbidospora mongoliensis TaxID=688067 RepID=UPI000A9FE016|nr:heparinase II/III family protein [Herbidospora mongoliensis]